MAVIDIAFEKLKQLNLARTTNEYSQNWLGMENSYYRCLHSKRRKASARVYGYLAKRLMDEAAAHRFLGKKNQAREMSELAGACINAIIYANDNDDLHTTQTHHAH